MLECRCEAIMLAMGAQFDQLTAEADDPKTSPERRAAIIEQFRVEIRQLDIAIARIEAQRRHA